MEDARVLSANSLEQIFSNIEAISAIHESLGKELKEVTEEDAFKPLLVIKTFASNVIF